MNYVLTPSLQNMAFTKIAYTVWNRERVRKKTSEFILSQLCYSLKKKRLKWQKIVVEVIDEFLPEFHLPEIFKKKLSNFIAAVGGQILSWAEHHKVLLGMRCTEETLNKLCWTPHGTVDQKKTAETLVDDETLKLYRRYKLACRYCLKDKIQEIWNKMPEYLRKDFYWEDYRYWEENSCEENQQALVFFWTYNMRGKLHKLREIDAEKWQTGDSIFLNAFRCAVLSGNKASTEYFWQKLNSMEREKTIVKFGESFDNRYWLYYITATNLPMGYFVDVLCFLLSQMDIKLQQELIRSSFCLILECLLEWPWQRFFMGTVNNVWNSLSEEELSEEKCIDVLSLILHKIDHGFKDYDYKKLFEEVWTQGPEAYKIFDSELLERTLRTLLKIRDKDSIKLILKDVTLEHRRYVIYRQDEMCGCFINKEDWDFLKFFMQECLSSYKHLVWFRNIMVEEMCKEILKNKDKLKKFNQLVDDLIHEDYKKRVEAGESFVAKRYRPL